MAALRPRFRLLPLVLLLIAAACGDSGNPTRPASAGPVPVGGAAALSDTAAVAADSSVGRALAGEVRFAAALAHPPCTRSWAGGVDGLWSDAAKWSPAGTPVAADVVCIEVAGTYTVTVIGSRSAGSVHVINPSATLRITGDNSTHTTLTLAATSTNEGTIVLTSSQTVGPQNAQLTIGGDGLTNAGTFRSERGPVATGARTLAAELDNQGTVEINTATTFVQASGSYINTGTFTLGDNAVLTISGNSQALRHNGGTLALGNGALVSIIGTARFGYHGGAITYGSATSEIRMTGAALDLTAPGGTATFNMVGASFLAAGSNLAPGHTVIVRGDDLTHTTFTAQTPFTNAGTIVLTSSGSVGPQNAHIVMGGPPGGTLTNTGTLRVERGPVLTGTRQLSGNLINSGTVEINTPTTFMTASGSYANTGAFTLGNNASLTISGNSQALRHNGGTLALGNGALVSIIGTARFGYHGGAITYGSATSEIRMTGAALDLTAPGGTATFNMVGASFLAAGSNLAPGHTVIVRGDDLTHTTFTAQTPFTNAGTIVLTSSGSVGPQNAHIVMGGPPGGTLTNTGTLRVERGPVLTGTRQFSGNLINSGTVEINTPTTFVTASGNYRNTGTFTVADAASLTISGNSQALRHNGGTLALGNGALVSIIGTARFGYHGGAITYGSATSEIRMTGAALDVTAPGGTATFNMVGASFLAAGSNLAPGHTVIVRGDDLTHTTFTAQTPFTNAGTIVLTSSGSVGPQNAHIVMGGPPGGTLTNTGTLRVERGPVPTGTRQFSGQLVNSGAIVIGANTTFVTASGNYTNTGDFTVTPDATLTINGNSQIFRSSGAVLGGGTLSFTDITFFLKGQVGAFVNSVGSTFHPGTSPGIANITQYAQGATSVMHVELGGEDPGTDYDQVNVATSAALAGTMQVAMLDGFVPCNGQTFEVMTYSSSTGAFTFVGLAPGLVPTVGPNSIVLTSVGGPTCDVPPVAHAGGPYSAPEGENLTLDGGGSSDAGGEPLTYEWSFGDGETGLGVTPDHIYADEGLYTITLTVRDPGGQSHTATTTATIGNVAPTVDAGDDAAVDVGDPFALSAGFSDPGVNDAPWTYRIDWGDGTPATTGSTSNQTAAIDASHTFAAGGTYTVTVQVTDEDGGSGTDHLIVTVEAVNEPPVADAGGPYTGIEGEEIDFDGAGSSDPEGGLLTYAWQFGDGGTSTSPSPSHTYADDGTYTVELTVTDPDGRSATVTTTATITNVAPTVNAGADGTVTLGTAFNVSATFADPGVNDAPWSWVIQWGDGSPATTGTSASQAAPITASHTFAAAGSYAVVVTVTDEDGDSGTDGLTVAVSAPPTGPIPVAIDVRPATIRLNDRSGGSLPVAVLSSATFDARLVDPTTITLGDGGGTDTPVARRNNGTPMASVEDVNGDGRPDLMLQFERAALQRNGDLTAATTSLVLLGRTTGGAEIRGVDAVRVLP